MTLSQFVAEFNAYPKFGQLLQKRDLAIEQREQFLRLYPPADIENCLRFRQQAENFVKWLEGPLYWLGGINLHSNQPVITAGNKRDQLIHLLKRSFAADRTVFQKVDLPWGQIPYFGDEASDRQIAKKIICTYYPDDTVPIFNTEHMEHFVRCLGLGPARDSLTLERFGSSYGGNLTVGRRWEILTTLLLAEKQKIAVTASEDNVYLMYCLYYSSASPLGFKPSDPH